MRKVLPCFVWNSDNLRKAEAAGYEAVSAIGAPFLYLRRRNGGVAPPERKGVIAYPFHAWEREGVEGGTHDDYSRELLEREGPVTVCLFWIEYEDPSVREVYETAGHRVIFHGHRNDPAFLERQMGELRAHRRMVSNRIGSALWYGGAMGMEVELYGPHMGVESGPGLERVYDGHRRQWPELFDGPVPSDLAEAIALRELGGEFVREPEELGELLGFTGRRRAVALAAPVTRGLMRLKKRLEGW